MQEKLTPNEQAYFDRIKQHVGTLKAFLIENAPPESDDTERWFAYIAQIRVIQGNTSNDQSFLAVMLAKAYLQQRFDIVRFDAADKAQGAPGLDIDVMTQDGERIIGEIKTTVPYGKNDLGSQQRETFRKDFNKLNTTEAHHKFFFLTNRRALEIVQRKYAQEIPGVEVVLIFDNGKDKA